MQTEEAGDATRRSWIRRYALWWWLALLWVIGVLRASNRYLVDVANDHASLFLPKLVEELTGAFSFGAFLPVLFYALRRMPATWYAHVGLFVALSLAQTSLMIGMR